MTALYMKSSEPFHRDQRFLSVRPRFTKLLGYCSVREMTLAERHPISMEIMDSYFNHVVDLSMTLDGISLDITMRISFISSGKIFED